MNQIGLDHAALTEVERLRVMLARLEKAARLALGEYYTMVATNDLADHYLPEMMHQLVCVLEEIKNAKS